jgi:hypothetical protein
MNRYLDGIYVRIGKENLCLSDMLEEDRLVWLSGLRKDELVRTANILAKTIKQIGDSLDIITRRYGDEDV